MKETVLFHAARSLGGNQFRPTMAILKATCFFALLISFSSPTYGTEVPEELIARLNTQTYQNPSHAYQDFVANFVAQHNIAEYKEAFPGAKTESLKRVQYIVPGNKSAIPNLKSILESSGYFDLVEIVYSYEVASHSYGMDEMVTDCSNPDTYNDPGALATQHIENMELPCAWSLTHGCPDISVAVVDVFFADNHPDLQGKFIEIKGGCNQSHNVCGHGYASAGGIGAIVNNGVCVAGSGYNTSLRGYCDGTSCSTCSPFSDMWPAYQDGNRVINVSCSGISSSQVFIDMVNEMTNNGVNLVVSAYGTGHSAYANIPGVINVAQLDIN
ncbi:MAG: hypothetical protein EPO28_01585 [Saprospiraceae bacterium]|nr:MAG: hypothetical protein EPO28_01585 [Saprospiraceae bacterium]